MKPWLILATVALLVFAWMFRYDVHSTETETGPVRIVKFDRWTGEVSIFVKADGTWVPYGRGFQDKPK